MNLTLNNSELYTDEIINVCRKELIKYPKSKPISKKQFILKLGLKLLNEYPKAEGFSWPNSLMTQSLEYSHKLFENGKDLEILKRYYDLWIAKGLPIDNLDNTMNGYSLVYLYEKTKEKKYKDVLDSLASYLLNHSKDSLNNLPYRETGSNIIFIDTLGMISPFLIRYGTSVGNIDLIDLGTAQLRNFLEHGFDDSQELPYHAYKVGESEKYGIIGWGRAVGWILIGIVDSLEYLDETHKDYPLLEEALEKLIKVVMNYQKDNGSFAWQLQAVEGSEDSSSTSMIGYSLIKAVKLKLIDSIYLDSILKIIDYLMSVTEDGYVMKSSPECRGLGQYPQKYGWYPWSQGPTSSMLAIYQTLDI